MIKVSHISDTHIKNLKYHYEYKIIFKQLYEILREEEVDYIVHCGDIAHTKTQISPEFVDLCASFFSNLANIAPTYIILGNHDGNLRNSSRQDALTPIVDALNHPDLHLLKNSGETHVNDELCFNVLSVFDEDNWVKPSDDSKINVALYHGAINNCTTDTGWKMDVGEHDLSIFKGHDYAMLGDIHKAQILDLEGRVRYAGSTIQQNHGESNDKGFLIWNIEDKNKFEVNHFELKNPKPFVTVELTKKGRIPKNTNILNGARLRLVSNNNLPLDTLRRAVEISKKRFKPESVTFLNRAVGKNGVINVNGGLSQENLRDLAVQEKLIKEFLIDYHADKEVIEKVLELNKKYNTAVEQDEEIARNINWELISLEWDNLFNYGKDNKINFENLNGIVGIFGKNFSGKSSIIDSLLMTLYNSISKNARKNLNVINQNKESAKGRVQIKIGDSQFVIERSIEKYQKKLKGTETTEAKTDIEFTSYDPVTNVSVSCNGLTRSDTDKNIRKRFGILDDFLLTSMASQNGALTFINEGSTRRKEILAKFLDLEFFEQKFRLAREDAADVKGALRRLENRNFDEEFLKAEKDLALQINKVQQFENLYSVEKEKQQELEIEISNTQEQIGSVPAEIIDIHQIKILRTEKKEKRGELKEENRSLRKECTEKRNIVKKIKLFLEQQFDIEEWNDKHFAIEEREQTLNEIYSSIESESNRLSNCQEKIKLLKEVPCGEEYSHCKFIKGAYEAKDEYNVIQVAIDKMEKSSYVLKDEIESFNPDKVEEYLQKYNQIVDREKELNNSLIQLGLITDKNTATRNSLLLEIKVLDKKIKSYEKNKDAIENLEKLHSLLKEKQIELSSQKDVVEQYAQDILEAYKRHGSFENRIQVLNEQKEELDFLREEYEAHDLFGRCMHPNGISYDIIKRKLPVINDEIAKVLANIVDFEVFFENEDRRLNIFIKHPKFDPRPIEMGSGAEKMISSTGIRLALLSISSLPKGNIIILDEPATELDEHNMEGFIRILDLMKSYYKIVLLISHLDTLKDCADMQIVIDKDNEGHAHVDC